MRRFFHFLLLPLLLFFATPISASEPPTAPILRIEAGSHTGEVNCIATDAAGRLAVTASADNTARLFDIKSRKLLRIFRPPIMSDSKIRLPHAALSPNGQILALGSPTSIYLFSTTSGRLLVRISGMPSVKNVKFSPDNKFLAITTTFEKVVIFYRVSDGAEVMRYTDSSYVSFSPNGQFVMLDHDGYLRLYGNSFNLIREVKIKSSNYYISAAVFSPNGTHIAVYVPERLDVFSGDNLSRISSINFKSTLYRPISWSNDSKNLYVSRSETLEKGYKGEIFRWFDFSKNKLDKMLTVNLYIEDFISLDNNEFILLENNNVKLINNEHKVIQFHNDNIANFYGDKFSNIKLSYEGEKVVFSYKDDKTIAMFDVISRELSTENVDIQDFYTSRTASKGLVVKIPGVVATLNDIELDLSTDLFHTSAAIAPDSESLIIGGTYFLTSISKDRKIIWHRRIHCNLLGINIPLKGRVCVVAYTDGTIRWHRLTDGEELLAFFPHADRQRWVMWTPSGYYDASPGGEELIGWHLNNGTDREADFFPAAKFRGTYYRPDIIDQILETLDEGEAIRLANAASGRKRQEVAVASILPPVATILSPVDGSTALTTDLTIRYAVRSPSGAPVTGVKVLIDGRPVAQSRGIGLKEKATAGVEESLAVTLPPQDCEVTLIAENANASSVPATVRLKWGGRSVKAETFTVQPKLYVLAVGVSDYADPTLKLGLAAKDAKDFAAVLEKQKGGLYREVVTKVLTDGLATKDDILDGLDWLRKETTSKDVAILFLAGHGVNDPSGIYYYLPHNANTDKLMRTGVPFSDIKNTVASLAGKTLFFVDTCHSGNVMGTRRAVADINAVVNELSSAENGAVVFASSTGRQYSLEDAKWGNGAFTKALVEGLSGKADYGGKGKITINMLDLYLSERVKELTDGKQTPTTTKPQTIQDFPIAVTR